MLEGDGRRCTMMGGENLLSTDEGEGSDAGDGGEMGVAGWTGDVVDGPEIGRAHV